MIISPSNAESLGLKSYGFVSTSIIALYETHNYFISDNMNTGIISNIWLGTGEWHWIT